MTMCLSETPTVQATDYVYMSCMMFLATKKYCASTGNRNRGI